MGEARTPIDRESVERSAERLRQDAETSSWRAPFWAKSADTLLALRAALDAAEAENRRMRGALQEISQESMGEDGCYYTNLVNIKRARAALQENPDGLG